jgi:hypothetical protein
MDQRLPYEQLIGAKLQGLTIPDMEDMIWARIKAQLDIDMPSDDPDDTGGDDDPSSPLTRGPLRWGLSVTLVALIAAFLIFNKKPTTPGNNPALPVLTQPANQPSNQPTGPPPGNDITTTPQLIPQVAPTPVGKPVDTTSLDVNVPVTTAIDSANRNKPDSIFTLAEPPPVKIDSSPPQKKGKGVRGLKEDDYRIVPKEQE